MATHYNCDFCQQALAEGDLLTTLDGVLHAGSGATDSIHLDACPRCAPYLKSALAQYVAAVAAAPSTPSSTPSSAAP